MAPTADSDHDLSPLRPQRSDGRSDGRSGGRAGRARQRSLAWLLMLLLPVSALPFATVHPGTRILLALVAGVVGGAALFVGGGRRGQPVGVRQAVGLGVVAGLVAGLSFLPLGVDLRAALLPGVSGPVSDALALAGHSTGLRPLALDPGRGLIEWAVYLAMVLVVGGTAAVVHNRPRARRLAIVVVLTGAGCAILGLVQRWTGAATVLWVTELPRSEGQPFFATFINPNHAGVLMAAGGPLAVALMRDRRATVRMVGAAAVLILLLGTLLSGSRGAAVLLAIGVGVALTLAEGKLARLAIGGVLLLGVAVVGLAGPGQVATWLTGALDPAQRASMAAGYGDVWGGRGQLYEGVWSMVTAAPVLGVGPAGFDDAWRVMRTGTGFTVADHAHQELLQAIIEHGVLATALALAAVGVLVRAALSPDPKGGQGLARMQAGFAGAVVVVIVASLYEFPLRAGALSVLAALSAGALLGLSSLTEDGPPPAGARGLAGLGTVLVLGGLALHLGARLADSGPFADPDAAILQGRAVQAAAGIGRESGWSQGGDDAALAQAAAAFQAALWRRPVDRIALQELARVRYRQGQADAAEEALAVATRVYPTLPWPWADLARVRRARGDHFGAWEAWSVALAFDLPPDFPVEAWLAEALQGPGGAGVAALAALPPRGDRWEAAARLVEAAGDRQEAALLFQEAATLDPEGRAQYAFALLRWGQADEVLRLLPADAASCGEQRARAEALRRLSRCEEALPMAEQALASCGAEDQDARLLIARTRLCLGDERAVGILEALLREAPEQPGPRRSLAHELARRGKTDDALRHLDVLEQAGQLKPADRELQELLRR